MNQDTKRICGPKETLNPYDYCPPDDTTNAENCLREGTRKNDRGLTKVRPLSMKSGVISQADGSGYIEMDATKVIAAVYGPREVTKKEEFSLSGQLTCEFKFAPFSMKRRRSAIPESDERNIAMTIIEAVQPAVCLHKFPKAQFNIYVTVLEHAGGSLPAAINCVSIALADAGVEMYDLITSVSALICGPHIFVDPSLEEETASSNIQQTGLVTLAYLPNLDQASSFTSSGSSSVDSLSEAINLCTNICRQLYVIQKRCLTENSTDKITTTPDAQLTQ